MPAAGGMREACAEYTAMFGRPRRKRENAGPGLCRGCAHEKARRANPSGLDAGKRRFDGGSGVCFGMSFRLLRAEDAVAGVAETGDDVAVFIEVIVEGGGVDFHIRVLVEHGLHAFGGGHEVE